MEVFIRNVPARGKEKKLTEFFQGVLEKLGMEDWRFHKNSRKSNATLTFLRPADGQNFLARYGPGTQPLMYNGKTLYCSVSNRLDKFAVQSLEYDRKIREQQQKEPNHSNEVGRENRELQCTSISCGLWDFVNSEPNPMIAFTSYFTLANSATLAFKSRSVVIEMGNSQRLVMPYPSIEGIAWSSLPVPAMIFTLREAPRSSRDPTTLTSPVNPELDEIQAMMTRLLGDMRSEPSSTSYRFPGLDEEHDSIAGGCLVYRIVLANQGHLADQIASLDSIRNLPPILRREISYKYSWHVYSKENLDFLQKLSATSLPFPVKFQAQRLVQNCYLPPQKVAEILPAIAIVFNRSGEEICVNVLRSLFREIPYAGPDVDPDLFDTLNLCKKIVALELNFQKFRSLLEGPVATAQVAVVHKVLVTPSGVYLEGPEGESNNRILRKYAAHQNYFLRIQFGDEDGSHIQYNRDISNAKIYKRFKTILTEGITIAGRHFSFLGHSHSSLRAHACWAVARFEHNGVAINDRDIVQELGDFTKFKCPARCAARIGQAFSDTRDALTLDPGVVREDDLRDVERNGRVFSDGVGTISMAALQLVWERLYRNKKKPTVLQIRYRGTKGMLSLDTRLQGTSIFLRPSMTKFMGSNSNDLEICSAGHKPIPLFLNEQFIKILEDLGVPVGVFLDLQAKEINRLRFITANTFNAGQFLKTESIGEKVHLPWFFKKLSEMGLAFQDDNFLANIVEAAVLIHLRTLKYKARIPVPNGFTLLGVMDETGILEEGQIFCIVDDERGESRVLTARDGGKVVISRSPALHPGDIQMAKAVTVPDNSPLMKLRNCICFSQKGSRDLPSMLSGGDLDGDIYSVFLDPELRPPTTYEPANYPRQRPVELERPVEKKDMIDFFVNFMETDQLGRICNAHKILADQSDQGVKDPFCITLAEMASTAVDYSKTGKEVDMSAMPRYSPCRPHFMAPGPNVEIIESKPTFHERLLNEKNADDEEGAPAFEYYRSNKILGRLFDAVDEKMIFDGVKQVTRDSSTPNWDRPGILLCIWNDIIDKTKNIDWKSQIARAKGICDEYEDTLLDLMYEYGPRPKLPLSEIEVFIGNILGKTGVVTPRHRELAMSMKERFEDILVSTVRRMTGKDPEEEGLEENVAFQTREGRLGLCISCLNVALCQKGKSIGAAGKERGILRSFGYVAGIVSLKEMQRAGM